MVKFTLVYCEGLNLKLYSIWNIIEKLDFYQRKVYKMIGTILSKIT